VPFQYTIAKGDRVLIEWEGRTVTVVSGAAGTALAVKLQRADAERTQQLLARATGNFKRGNERSE
jgi:uncharacterized protein (DUF2252 family)